MVQTSCPVPSFTRPRPLRGLTLLLLLVAAASLVVVEAARAARPRRAAPPKAAVQRGPRPPEAGVYRIEALTAREMARIDRDLAVVLQPIGGLEPFGPHLPVGAVALVSEELALAAGQGIRKLRPDLTVVLLPTLSAAPAPAVAYGMMQLHPTALNVSSATFREALFNSTLRLAEGAWRHYFTVSYAFSPEQNRRQDEICAFLRDVYGMKAANVSGLALVDSAGLARQAALAVKMFQDTLEVNPRLDIHGGTALTSLILALNPALVDPGYTELSAVPLKTLAEFPLVATRLGWPTYVGAPARASAGYGRELLHILADVNATRILGVLNGSAPPTGPTPTAWATEEFNWRDPLRNMGDWEIKKRRLYDVWLKAHDTNPVPVGTPH